MTTGKICLMFCCLVISCATAGFCQPAGPDTAAGGETGLETILSRLEKRYRSAGFTADFTQTSSLKAMQITDTASGKAMFKRPGMMRWEYEVPDRQQIITDGKKLWIYRPDEDQVTVGSFPAFFGDGKGASFLSDIGSMRTKFDLSMEGKDEAGNYVIRMEPKNPIPDITLIHISVSAETYDVVRIVTFNSYGDETRIALHNISHRESMADDPFHFEISEHTDIVQLNE